MITFADHTVAFETWQELIDSGFTPAECAEIRDLIPTKKINAIKAIRDVAERLGSRHSAAPHPLAGLKSAKQTADALGTGAYMDPIPSGKTPDEPSDFEIFVIESRYPGAVWQLSITRCTADRSEADDWLLVEEDDTPDLEHRIRTLNLRIN